MKSLQILKDHAETSECTFQPEINLSADKDSHLNSSRKEKSTMSGDDTFNRLHSDYERH